MVEKYFHSFKTFWAYFISMIGLNYILFFVNSKAFWVLSIPKTITIKQFEYSYQVINKELKYDIKYIVILAAIIIIIMPIVGIFIRLITSKVLQEQEVHQVKTFKESLKYYKRYLILNIIVYGLYILMTFLAGIFSRLAIIAFIFLALGAYFSIIFALSSEYLIYNDEDAIESMIQSKNIAKPNWFIILMFSIVSAFIVWLEKTSFESGNLIIFFIVSVAFVLFDTYYIMYRMNMCVNEIYYTKEKFYERIR